MSEPAPRAPGPDGTWYDATCPPAPVFAPLGGDARADVAVVGGGYTGLSAALHLAEAGLDVVLLEARAVGGGASGRNGGQLHSGQRRDVDWLERRFGREDAHRLWRLAEDAKALVHDLVARHRIDCGYRPGVFAALHKARMVDGERRYVDRMRDDYGYALDWHDRERLARALGTDVYHGGWRDAGAGHLHPLAFARGLARAAAAAGARIHESTEVTSVSAAGTPVLTTRRGSVRADAVLLAGNGYMSGLNAPTEARVMPLDNYMIATEPVGAGAPGGVMPGGEAASDSRFVVNYWRPTADGRLLFGGGETYTRRRPADIAAFVRRRLAGVYPQLRGVRIDHAWGGTLAVTAHRLPFLRRLRPGVYAAAGYSGQGLALAPFCGRLVAEAIAGDTARFDVMASLPCPPFPGGRWLRAPVLALAMTWFALRDRL